jgi:Heparinase II/III-like protein
MAASVPQITEKRISEIAAWLPGEPAGFGRPVTDRVSWQKLAEKTAYRQIIADAERLAAEPIPPLTDDLFLDFSRTGNRERCQRVLGQRDSRLSTLAIAECLEDRGRFLAPLTEILVSIASEKTWVYPAHDGALRNFRGQARDMDLRATLIAWDFATVDYLLAPKLSPQTRSLIRSNVEARVLLPFREMVSGKRPEISWMHATHNWNAVCLAGTTCAALALEPSREDRAFYVAAAEHYIRFFLSGFTPDGYCSEGLGYWNYGFGRFLMLSEAVRQATGRNLDLLAEPTALQPALFWARSEIINGLYPTIADCHPGTRPDPLLVRYICERFGMELPKGFAANLDQPSRGLGPALMFSFLPEPLPRISAAVPRPDPLRTWFQDGGVLICRPSSGSPAFAAVLKGGNNAEHHNHNDVGSFSVVCGTAMSVCDPGAEIYTARTFGSHRYESKVLSSFGHAVPVIAGQLQRTGAEARAVVLQSDFSAGRDLLKLDIHSAYAVPELKALTRTFTFERGAGTKLVVLDEVAFTQPETFETALITWGKWEKSADRELLLADRAGGTRVEINTGGQTFQVTAEQINEDLPSHQKPTRIAISLLKPVQSAKVTLTFRPVAGGGDARQFSEREQH